MGEYLLVNVNGTCVLLYVSRAIASILALTVVLYLYDTLSANASKFGSFPKACKISFKGSELFGAILSKYLIKI